MRFVGNERGMALIMAIGIMAVLGTAGATSMYYATAGARTSNYSNTKSGTFSLAEAGIASIMSVLNNPTTNALDPDALCPTGQHTPCSQTTTYPNGTVTWSGVLNRSTAVWDVTSIGSSRNSSASPSKVTQKLTAKVTVTPTNTQPLNNPSWNYMFATRTGNTCDETLNNNVGGGSRMYVAGNLCVSNNANLAPSALVVLGNLDVDNNASIGSSSSMSTRTETYVGGWCHYGKGTTADPCTDNQDANNIFSKKNPPSYIVGVNNSPTLLVAPTTDFPGWYENSIPGPSQSCTTSSGTPPVFDTNYPTRDNSVANSFDLTPASSYTCRVGPAGSPSGELSWNASTNVLTVSGTMFIDGSAKITNSLASYNGQAALYLSGTFLITGKLCGSIAGGGCDVNTWNPNTEMLTVVTNGTGGSQVPAGDGVQMANGAGFQGALYSSGAIDMGNNAMSDGPMVGTQILLSNNVTTSAFGNITTVPVGQPGNPEVYAQPNPPQMFSG